MPCKPFPWRKLTPSQIDLMERLAGNVGALPYVKLEYRDLIVFEELRKLGFVDLQPKGRSKLEAVLTVKGRDLQRNGYRANQIIVRVTEAQIILLRNLDHERPNEEISGRTVGELPGMMLDTCRRMVIRGWAEWHGGTDGLRWARLTPGGREVHSAITEMDKAVEGMALARSQGRLH